MNKSRRVVVLILITCVPLLFLERKTRYYYGVRIFEVWLFGNAIIIKIPESEKFMERGLGQNGVVNVNENSIFFRSSYCDIGFVYKR